MQRKLTLVVLAVKQAAVSVSLDNEKEKVVFHF